MYLMLRHVNAVYRVRKTSMGVVHTLSPDRNGPQHSPCDLPEPHGHITSFTLSTDGIRVFILSNTSSRLGGGAPNPLVVVRAALFFFLLLADPFPFAASAV
mgnify:CR=1 FL=1